MLTVSVALLWVLMIVLSVLVVVLYRQFGLIYIGSRSRIEQTGLQVGSSAPEGLGLRVEDEDTSWSWNVDGAARGTFVLMADPDCRLCADLIPRLNGVAEKWLGTVRLIVLDSDKAARPDWSRELPWPRAWMYAVDTSGEMQKRFDVQATPFGFLVDGKGTVVEKGLVNAPSHIDSMIRAVIGDSQGPGALGLLQRGTEWRSS